MKNHIKKALAFVGTAFGSLAVLAEATGSSTSGIVAVDDMTGIFTQAQTDMTSLISAALPVVVLFVSGGLIIWGGLALVSLLKRGFGAGKGR